MISPEKGESFIKVHRHFNVHQDYSEYHTDAKVHFSITLPTANLAPSPDAVIEKKFKLSTTISTNNLVCFDAPGSNP